MKNLMTIEVKGFRLFAAHGLHDEEAMTGNEFEVNASVSFIPTDTITSISGTIDYTRISNLIKEEMKKRKQLLETVAQEIASKLKQAFPQIVNLSISIKKLTPPIANFNGTVGVTYSRDFTL
jgi:7,8-dihydroneopterin aldolase/epimerase/oxygenase